MGVIITLAVCFFLFRWISNFKKGKLPATKKSSSGKTGQPLRSAGEIGLANHTSSKYQYSSSPSQSSSNQIQFSNMTDRSIIDVSGDPVALPLQKEPTQPEVPYWPHFYVYGFDDLKRANGVQKEFYGKFKNAFLEGFYYDLRGNSNYAFILLFDFLKESEAQSFLIILEKRLLALSERYPKTAPYCRSLLLERMQQRGDSEGLERVQSTFGYSNTNGGYDDSHYRLGSRYMAKMKLDAGEVALLNHIWDPANNFCGVEFCLQQVIRVFIATVKELDRIKMETGRNLSEAFKEVAHAVATKQYRYRQGSPNYKYAITSVDGEIYRYLFKFAENAVREHFGHKRKLNTDSPYIPAVTAVLQEKVLNDLPEALNAAVHVAQLPDEATEIELNSQNTARWKPALEQLKESWVQDPVRFLQEVVLLGKLNARNPSVELIFFEASKAIAKADRATSLALYLHYIYHDLRSVTFDNRSITKTLQKSLFKTDAEVKAFEEIVAALVKSRDLQKALDELPAALGPRRRKIQLDSGAIHHVKQRHTSTVGLLEEILTEDDEPDNGEFAILKMQEIAIDVPVPISEASPTEAILAGAQLTQVQKDLVDLFQKQSLTIADSDLESFARAHGVFKNSLVSGVNELFYEKLDDVLIEEEDDVFVMNQHYFSQLKQML
jgi:hypothetical protein